MADSEDTETRVRKNVIKEYVQEWMTPFMGCFPHPLYFVGKDGPKRFKEECRGRLLTLIASALMADLQSGAVKFITLSLYNDNITAAAQLDTNHIVKVNIPLSSKQAPAQFSAFLQSLHTR